MTIILICGDWNRQHTDAQAVRQQVFILEQGVPVELEWDEMDALCLHVVAYDDGQPIGTGRLLPDGHIGRMAVTETRRRAGIGSAILARLMQEAKNRGDRVVALNAQVQVQAFYRRHGFVAEGDIFMDAGIPHIHMHHEFE